MPHNAPAVHHPRHVAGRAALLALAVLIPILAVPPAAALAAPASLDTGELTWGLRQSFREYVGVDSIHPSDGATMSADGVLGFPLVGGEYDADTTRTDLRFGGQVRYATYCGYFEGQPADECTLDVTISDLHLVVSRDEQILYGHVSSRPLSPLGAGIIDYGIIPVATLDVAAAVVASTAGTTTWSGMGAAVAAEFSPAITYPAGAPLDPLSLVYEGPGGKPDLSEHWTPAGTIGLEETARWTRTGDVNGMWVDDARGVVHVVRSATSAAQGPHVQALDATTLAVEGDSGTLGHGGTPSGYRGAFDAGAGTVFTALTATDRSTRPPTTVTTVYALTWNPATGAYDDATVGAIPAGANVQTNLVWDGEAVYALTFRSGDAASVLQRWTRDGSGWAHSAIPLPAGAGATPTTWYRPGDANYGFAAVAPGLFVVTRQFVSDPTGELLLNHPSALSIAVRGDTAEVAAVAGTGTDEWVPAGGDIIAWSRVSAADDGRIAFSRSGGDPEQAAILFGRADRGAVAVDDAPVTFAVPSGASVTGEFDPASSTYWAKAKGVGLLRAIVGGVAQEPIAHQDSFYFAGLAVGGDHTLYTALRDPARIQGVARLAQTGVSPTVTTHPASMEARVASVTETVGVRLSARAVGEPVPSVQWQVRATGAARFGDIDGATDPILALEAGASDNGAEYRAVFTNRAGTVATEPATLTVFSPPTIALQPSSTTVDAGGTAQFLVMPGGYPEPTIVWQRYVDGSWRDIANDDQHTAAGGYLTIERVRPDQDGSRFRAQLTSSAGSVNSDEAVMRVTSPWATRAGSLTWGVKTSFRSYIVGPIAKGAISLSAGASSSGGAFRFGQSSADWNGDAGTGSASYAGAVRFTGHAGLLDVTLSNPAITVGSARSATLSVSVNGSRVVIGNVDLAAAVKSPVTGGVGYANAPVTLTAAGASVFSYGASQFYGPGTAMDPVSFVIGANAANGGGSTRVASYQGEEAWTPPAEPPATTGIEGDPAELAEVRAGQELTVWADGFQPNEEGIKVVVYSEPLVLESNLTADATGRATWTGILPAELEPGAHTLTFQGSVSRGIVLDVHEPVALEGCTVAGATLSWGFKESFRAYIDGSIANGEWTVSDGATYETPLFGWSGGTGVYDVATASGQVGFAGGIRFTGHEGLLDTTVANPRLQFVDENTAYLLLDVAGVTMEDALAGVTDPVVATAVPFVKLDLSGGDVVLSADGSTLVGVEVPTAITEQGFQAFPNYEAGSAFDPMSFSIPIGADCTTAIPAQQSDPETDAVADTAPDLTWLWWLLGAVLLAAIVATVVVLLVRRRRAA